MSERDDAMEAFKKQIADAFDKPGVPIKIGGGAEMNQDGNVDGVEIHIEIGPDKAAQCDDEQIS